MTKNEKIKPKSGTWKNTCHSSIFFHSLKVGGYATETKKGGWEKNTLFFQGNYRNNASQLFSFSYKRFEFLVFFFNLCRKEIRRACVVEKRKRSYGIVISSLVDELDWGFNKNCLGCFSSPECRNWRITTNKLSKKGRRFLHFARASDGCFQNCITNNGICQVPKGQCRETCRGLRASAWNCFEQICRGQNWENENHMQFGRLGWDIHPQKYAPTLKHGSGFLGGRVALLLMQARFLLHENLDALGEYLLQRHEQVQRE